MKRLALFLLLFLLLTTGGMRAQASVPSKAAVLEVLIRPQDTALIFSQKATDIVAEVVAGKGRYAVTLRPEMEREIKDQNFYVPLNQNGKQQLGRGIGADKVVSGEVTGITFTDRPRRAHVTLSLSLFDVVAGEMVYETLKAGDSSPKARGTDAELVEQALKQAAEAAFNPPPVVLRYDSTVAAMTESILATKRL